MDKMDKHFPEGSVISIPAGLATWASDVIPHAEAAGLSLSSWHHIHVSEAESLIMHHFVFFHVNGELTQHKLPTEVKHFLDMLMNDEGFRRLDHFTEGHYLIVSHYSYY